MERDEPFPRERQVRIGDLADPGIAKRADQAAESGHISGDD